MKKLMSLFLALSFTTTASAYVSGEAYWSEAGTDMSVDDQRATLGCFARFHMDKTHDFIILNMLGNSSVSDIDHVLGLDIEKDINFIEVGPKAVVRIYDNEDFVDYRGQIEAGTLYDDHDKLDVVDSFEVVCLD
ncbi:MAG: hypothetical protein CME63_05835 [Halobacteriovoraceae bacterium]|nr:hypothetical protein [Halobacteriovoraceae bacterium]MBC97249.1 hypothetical protein [Halobacteriovoraceae bacterium]|tara:strand:+ start:28942 stop:29343 length:402 start_codon:yes stop_codon:yes gene_type:complete